MKIFCLLASVLLAHITTCVAPVPTVVKSRQSDWHAVSERPLALWGLRRAAVSPESAVPVQSLLNEGRLNSERFGVDTIRASGPEHRLLHLLGVTL